MNCKKIAVNLSWYDMNELNEAEAQEVENHLAICGQCRQTLRDNIGFMVLLRKAYDDGII